MKETEAELRSVAVLVGGLEGASASAAAAVTVPLPVGGFGWMHESEINHWREILCILEVDLEYPIVTRFP